MDFLPKESYKRILVITFYAVLTIALGFIFVKYLLKLILPFLVAWAVSLIIRPMSETLHKRTKIPKKLISIILVFLVLVLIGLVLFLIIDKLIYEFRGIVLFISNNADRWVDSLLEITSKAMEKVPFLQSFGSEEELRTIFSGLAQKMMTRFTDNVPNMLKGVLTILPNLLFVSLVLIMASYYFCADYDEIIAFIKSIVPKRMRNNIKNIKKKLRLVGMNVIKGYLLTMALTFLQLYIGFLILKTEYAFAIALITALVDILPVIGVGTVLIPWAAVKLIAGSYYQGFGLLIIFAVVSIVREIFEPRIIGKSIGLHPLATLFSMYLGLELCGFIGLISFPVLVIIIKTIFVRESVGE